MIALFRNSAALIFDHFSIQTDSFRILTIIYCLFKEQMSNTTCCDLKYEFIFRNQIPKLYNSLKQDICDKNISILTEDKIEFPSQSETRYSL